MNIVCFFCFRFWLLCIFWIFVFLFSILPFLVNKDVYIKESYTSDHSKAKIRLVQHGEVISATAITLILVIRL